MDPTENKVQVTRAWTGLMAVVIGDLAVALAAIGGLIITGSSAAGSGPVVSILSSAFTTIGTLTTAYFGIRAATNTAQTIASRGPAGDGGAGSETSVRTTGLP
jgi:hypothetical protein